MFRTVVTPSASTASVALDRIPLFRSSLLPSCLPSCTCGHSFFSPPPFLLSSLPPCVLSFLPSFLSFFPSFLPSCLPSAPSAFPCFLPPVLSFFLSFLPSFRPSLPTVHTFSLERWGAKPSGQRAFGPQKVQTVNMFNENGKK